MKNKKTLCIASLICLVTCSIVLMTASAQAETAESREGVTPAPPMGWNSFDAYDCRINGQVYHDVTVTNTTIVMGQNSVPIQLGWGSYGSGAKGVFRNVKIYGIGGRGPSYPVIAARHGEYKKTLLLDNCSIDNPRGALFHLYDTRAHVNVTIENSPIQLKTFGPIKASTEISINGARYAADAAQSCWDMPTVRVTGCDHTLPVMKRVASQ